MAFTCAFPPKGERRSRFPARIQHPRPYQLEVQSHIRNVRPGRTDSTVLLGYDDVGLAAFCEYRIHPDGDAIPGHFIKVLARANRTYGGDVAAETLAETLRRMREHGTHDWVLCRIDQQNRASRAFFRASGFEMVRHDDSPQLWARELAAPSISATFMPTSN